MFLFSFETFFSTHPPPLPPHIPPPLFHPPMIKIVILGVSPTGGGMNTQANESVWGYNCAGPVLLYGKTYSVRFHRRSVVGFRSCSSEYSPKGILAKNI